MNAIKQWRNLRVGEVAGVLFFVVLGIWAYFGNHAGETTVQPSKQRKVVHASWDALLSQYSENELAFAAKYKGDDFNMRGVVVSVIAGGMQPGVFATSPQGTLYESTFLDSNSPQLAQLKAGDVITFTCGTFENGVMMQDCRLGSVAKEASP